METGIFEQYLETSRQRLELLIQRADKLPKPVGDLSRQSEQFPAQQEQLLLESLEELSIALEELQVASEDLRQINEELLASRQEIEAERRRYKELFDLAPEGYLVSDLQGAIVEANLAAGVMLKVKSERLAGKPLSLFVAESERRNFRTQLNLLVQKGGSTKNWLLTLQPRKGEQFQAVLTVTPIKNAAGELEGLRWGLFRLPIECSGEQSEAVVEELEEINSEFRLEEPSAVALEIAREEKQQRRARLFRISFEKAGVGMALLDRGGYAIESNEALEAIVGYSRQELRQISLMNLTHPKDRQFDREFFEELISGKRDFYRVEKRLFTKAMKIKQIALTIFLIRDGNFTPLLTAAVIHEIPEDWRLNCNSELEFESRVSRFYNLSRNGL
ncbi:PAS domain-containing protein [Phormidium nigroviride]